MCSTNYTETSACLAPCLDTKYFAAIINTMNGTTVPNTAVHTIDHVQLHSLPLPHSVAVEELSAIAELSVVGHETETVKHTT